jgi:hypothetical protein
MEVLETSQLDPTGDKNANTFTYDINYLCLPVVENLVYVNAGSIMDVRRHFVHLLHGHGTRFPFREGGANYPRSFRGWGCGLCWRIINIVTFAVFQ